jgi:hypothetical protein
VYGVRCEKQRSQQGDQGGIIAAPILEQQQQGVVQQHAGKPEQQHRQQVKNKRIGLKYLINQCKQNQRHGAVAAARYQGFLAFHLEKPKKRVLGQDARDAARPLRREHIVRDDDAVVQHKAMRQRVGVQDKGQHKNQNT